MALGSVSTQMVFDPTLADLSDNDNIGSFVRAGTDGDLISSTLIAGKEGLDVNLIQADDKTSAELLAFYDEDDPHSSGDRGQFFLAVRHDADTSMVDTDGDYAPLQIDENGRLKVVADIEVLNGHEKAEDSPHSSGDIGSYMLAVRADSRPANANTDADGDYASLFVDNEGALWTVPVGTAGDDEADNENPVKVGSRSFDGALTAVSASNDRADLLSDPFRRVYVNSGANIGLANTQVDVDNTGDIEIIVAASALAGRRLMLVQNLSPRPVYVGATGVTAADGIEVKAKGHIELDLGPNVSLYGIGVLPALNTQDLRILEIG